MNKKILNKIKEDTILLFDLDGTLINTDYSNFLAYKKAIDEAIGKISLEYNPKVRFNRDELIKTFPNLKSDQLSKIIQLKEKYYNDFLIRTTVIKPTYDILRQYFKTNTTILVTASRESRALAILDYHSLTNMLNHLIFKNEETDNKFECLFNTIEIDIKKSLLFENDETEIKNALKVGFPSTNIIKIGL